MKTTAGIVITDGKKVFLGHVTGSSNWDIQKGIVDQGEDYIDAAIRECKEESGLIFTKEQLDYLGVFDYNPLKQLALFKAVVDKLPDPKSCFCTTHFTSSSGKQKPEIDGFKTFPHEIGILMLSNSMQKVFKKYNILGDYNDE